MDKLKRCTFTLIKLLLVILSAWRFATLTSCLHSSQCWWQYGGLSPADGVVIESNDLTLDEASLTGKRIHPNRV